MQTGACVCTVIRRASVGTSTRSMHFSLAAIRKLHDGPVFVHSSRSVNQVKRVHERACPCLYYAKVPPEHVLIDVADVSMHLPQGSARRERSC